MSPHIHSADLEETTVNDIHNDVLLLRGHFVIGRQTESTTENIGPDVDSRAFYVGICAASAVTLNRHERVGPVDRLHMHGL